MNVLLITYPLNGLIMVLLPVGLGIYLTRRFQMNWRLFWIGSGTFVLSQVGHLPFNLALDALFKRGILPVPPAQWQVIFSALLLGLSAGLWEEGARYAVFRWWAKEARSWKRAVLLGSGHGGIEAILLGAYVLFVFFNMLALRDANLSQITPPEQLPLAIQQIESYWSADWYMTLLGALERSFTIPIQISFSVIMLQAFTRRQIRWFFLAIGWHALIDALIIFSVRIWSPFIAEAMVAVFFLVSLSFILWLRTPESAPEDIKPVEPERSARIEISPIEETLENLENTRYN